MDAVVVLFAYCHLYTYYIPLHFLLFIGMCVSYAQIFCSLQALCTNIAQRVALEVLDLLEPWQGRNVISKGAHTAVQ